MKALLLVVSILVTSSLCALLATDMIASVHLIEDDQLHPLSEIFHAQTLKHRETALVSLKFGDRHYVLDLIIGDDIVSPDFVHLNLEDGTEKPVEHNLFEHCIYSGHVRGLEKSEVHILTCGGRLRGTIRVPNELINVRQTEEGQTVVSLHPFGVANGGGNITDNMETNPSPLAETETDFPDLPTLKRQAPNNVLTVLYVVAPSGKKRYLELGWTVQDAVRTELFMADAMFQKVGLRVQIVAILESPELSNPTNDQQDRGSIVKSDFNAWHSKIAKPKRDYSWYRSAVQNAGIGKSSFQRVCRSPFPSGTGQLTASEIDIRQWAGTFIHEVGHAVGMAHDDDVADACGCRESQDCVMSYAGSSREWRWTPCALKTHYEWLKFINDEGINCLQKTGCTYGEWSEWKNTNKCGGYKFRTQAPSGPCIGPRQIQKNPACPKAVLEKDEDSIKNSDTNSVPDQLLVGVIVGCSIFVAAAVVVVVAVGLYTRRKTEERA